MSKKKEIKYVIKDNVFKGVEWDGAALESVKVVADALLVNANALLKLSALFHMQDVNIDCMLKVTDAELGVNCIKTP